MGRPAGKLAPLLAAFVAACSSPDEKPLAAGPPVDTVRVVIGGGVATPQAAYPEPAPVGDSAEVADVISRFYRNVDTGNLRAAYDLLDESPDRRSFEEFVREHEGIRDIRAMTGKAGGVSAAAGSRYIEVPVTLAVTMADGRRVKRSGSHTLRKSALDGATAAQRSWRIFSVKVPAGR